MNRLAYVVQKEARQIRRDRRILGMLIFAPIFQLTMFGYVVNLDVKSVPVTILDESRSQRSRQLINEIAHVGYFDVKAPARSEKDLYQALDRGESGLALHIPGNYSDRLLQGRTAVLQLLVDGSDSNTAGLATQYLAGLVAQEASRVVVQRLERQGIGRPHLPALSLEPRVWYNPNLMSRDFTVPGVLGLILFVLTINLTGLSIVREREIGTLEQLMVTPLRPLELMLGKLVPFVVIGLGEMLLITVVALTWFHVPLRGNFFVVLVSALGLLLNSLGTGLVVSTISRTQQQAQLTSFFLVMPAILLSGFMFPIANMPPLIQWATYVIPLRYFLIIVRGVFLKGVGASVLWPQFLALFALGAVTFSIGVLSFRKRMG